MENALKWVTPELLELVGMLAVFLIGFFKTKDRIRGKKYEAALYVLKDATMETYNTFVQELKAKKAAKGGGKLSIKEKKEAMDRTIDMAEDMAKEKGIDLAKALGSAYLPGLVEGIVSHEKKRAKAT